MAKEITETTPLGLKDFWGKLQPYQNIIFFGFLIVFLVILLLVWRSYRVGRLEEQCLLEWGILTLDRPEGLSAENMRSMLLRYRPTKYAPLIQFTLANALAKDGKFTEAQKEYIVFLKDYPDHPFAADAKTALSKIEKNLKWAETEPTLKSELKEKRNLPYVTIKTIKGDFEVELYEDDAPNTVANFITLAESGAYSQTPFAEIKTDLGLCLGTKGITPTFTIPFETNELSNAEGTLGMIRNRDPEAKDDKAERQEFLDSADTRFYISLKRNTEIDGKYTVFGRVTKGMDIVRGLTPGIEITGVVINKKRDHSYEPARIKKETPAPAPPPPEPENK